MKKADVETRWDRNHYRPTVNVKTWANPREATLPDELDEQQAHAFREFVEQLTDEDIQVWYDAAREDGWEVLQSDAEDIWGTRYGKPVAKVWSDGRCGGWAVVDGLDDLDSWDAIALGRWRKFARWARATADDVAASTLRLILWNVWEPRLEEIAEATAELNVPDVFRAMRAASTLKALEVTP